MTHVWARYCSAKYVCSDRMAPMSERHCSVSYVYSDRMAPMSEHGPALQTVSVQTEWRLCLSKTLLCKLCLFRQKGIVVWERHCSANYVYTDCHLCLSKTLLCKLYLCRQNGIYVWVKHCSANCVCSDRMASMSEQDTDLETMSVQTEWLQKIVLKIQEYYKTTLFANDGVDRWKKRQFHETHMHPNNFRLL